MRPWIVAAIVAASLPITAQAQQKPLKDQLVGNWDVLTVNEDYGNSKVERAPFGANLKGVYNFEPNGRVTLILIGDDLPSKPMKAQESARLVVAWFGKYTVEGDTLTVVADRATIPAFDGLARKTAVKVNGDDATVTAAPVNGPQGTFTPILSLKRAH